jgi:colanic acid biosynthesis glycosyl transferase WcaI
MRLLIYSANYAPEPTGIGKYSGEMASWLAAQGHEVRVIAAPPYYPDWRVAEAYRGRGWHREVMAGVQVWRAPLWVPSQPGGAKRLLHLLSFAVTSAPGLWMQWRWRPAVVLVVAPAFVCAPLALLLARSSGARAWLHVQDFEVDVAFNQGLLKGAWLRAAVTGVERWLFKRFDRVSSISQRMLQRARDKGVQAADLVFFPNWVDLATVSPDAQGSAAYRKQLDIAPDSVVALFSGTLGRKQGLMVLPEAARRLQGVAPVVFVICGDGAMKAELTAACAGMANVRLLPLQPLARLGALLGMADLHLLPQSADAADLVMPSKLTGMLASGRPVIATTMPDTEIAITLADCGVVVPPDDAAALAAAVAALAADAPRRQQLGRQARRYAEHHLDKAAVLGGLQSQLQALQARPPRR